MLQTILSWFGFSKRTPRRFTAQDRERAEASMAEKRERAAALAKAELEYKERRHELKMRELDVEERKLDVKEARLEDEIASYDAPETPAEPYERADMDPEEVLLGKIVEGIGNAKRNQSGRGGTRKVGSAHADANPFEQGDAGAEDTDPYLDGRKQGR